jgi:outer membrane lipoprotein carrier protein
MTMKIKTSEVFINLTPEVFLNLRGLVLLPFAFILLLAFSVSAQDKGKELLESVQKKYKSINDLSADFKQSLNGKASLNGKIFFSQGNKLRLELKNSTIISNGTILWNYNKGQKKVVINNVSGSDSSSFSIDKFLYDYPSKSSVTLEKEDNHDVLVLVPQKDNNMNFKKTRILVNQDYMIIHVSIENLSGTTTILQFSNYKLNQNLPESKFTFSPPEGTNVIDLRK